MEEEKVRIRFKATSKKRRHGSRGIRLRDGQTAEVSHEDAEHLFKWWPDNFEEVKLRLEKMPRSVRKPKELSRITLVTIHYHSEELLRRRLLSYLPQEIEYIQLDNANNSRWDSAAKALNYAMGKAANDLIVFSHEDVSFKPGWFKSLLEQECRLKDWGVLGIMGLDFAIEKIYWGSDYEAPEKVPLLDECCLVLDRKSGLRFDEGTFTHWHCYGLDLCMQCHRRGLGVYAITGPAFHECKPEEHAKAWSGRFRPDFALLREKWGGDLSAVKKENAGPEKKAKKGAVAFIPFRDINTASSRFRCYHNAAALTKLGWGCQIGSKNIEKADIVIFQKRYSGSDLDLAKRCRGKVILDICDADWLSGRQEEIEAMAENASCVTAPSTKIADWFRQRGKEARVIPDGFDFAAIPEVAREDKLTICWIGDTGNEKYLEVLLEPLNRLREEFDFNLKIIGDTEDTKLPKFSFQPELVKWTLPTELEEVARCHIGVAPLFLDERCSYKGANKAVTYMALGLAVACTSIPSYREIVADGQNGFLVEENDPQKWYESLKTLMSDGAKKSSFIKQGRKLATAFSLDNVARKWSKLFEELS